MRIRTIETRSELLDDGSRCTWHAGGTFEVDDARALAWIREGAAEDDTGRLRRVDLLTYDAAVAAGLVDAAVTPEAFEAQRRSVVPPPEPAPPRPRKGAAVHQGAVAPAHGANPTTKE